MGLKLINHIHQVQYELLKSAFNVHLVTSKVRVT